MDTDEEGWVAGAAGEAEEEDVWPPTRPAVVLFFHEARIKADKCTISTAREPEPKGHGSGRSRLVPPKCGSSTKADEQ